MADEEASLRSSELRSLDKLTQNLSKSSELFGKSITTAFTKAIVDGKRFEDVLRSLGKSMTESLLKTALKPLQNTLSGLFSGGLQGLTGLFSGLGGGTAVQSAPVAAFADGGVVASPSYFPVGRGLGLVGERGAEAILPLARGADGRLGVRSGNEARRPLSVTVQVSTPDAESFRRSEAQLSAAIARAVARGSRAL